VKEKGVVHASTRSVRTVNKTRSAPFLFPLPAWDNIVIPAQAGIQYYQVLWGFRVKPGMTGGGIFQRSHELRALNHTPSTYKGLL
jgi:hypothetical protein